MIDTIIALIALIVGFMGGFRLGMAQGYNESKVGKIARDILGRPKKAQIVKRDVDEDINQIIGQMDN